MIKRLLGWSSLLLLVGWLLASFFVFPTLATSVTPNPVTTSPADVGLGFDDIEVTTQDGVTLAGWWLPAAQPRGVLLFAHGAGSNRTSWFLPSLAFYKELVARGLSVITVDMRNHGNSPRTDGTWGMGSEEWPDVIAMARWLDSQGHSTLPRIAMGVSMGGATTINALEQGLEVRGVVLLDPALNTRDALAHGGWVGYGLPAWLFQPFAWATTTFWGLPSGERDAGALATQLNVPTLLIQDPADPITRLPYAQRLADATSQVKLAIAPETPANAECLAGKGRWGTHVAAFKCHPTWTLSQLDQFLNQVLTDS